MAFKSNNRSGGGRGGNSYGGNRGGYGGGRNSGGRGFGGGGYSDRPQMHKAVCDNCGKNCEVPFKPTGERPVYCSDCFEEMGNVSEGRERGNRDRGGNRSYDRQDFSDRKMFSAICDNCGNKCEVPFKPTGEKPVYCNDCFGKMTEGGNFERPERRNDRQSGANSGGAGNNNELKDQMSALNTKLDKIISLLEPKATVPAKSVKKETVLKEVTPAKEAFIKEEKSKKAAKAEMAEVKPTTKTAKPAKATKEDKTDGFLIDAPTTEPLEHPL